MSIYSLKVNVSYKLFSIKCWKEFETAFQSGIDRIKKKQNVLEALITGHLCKAQHFVKKKKDLCEYAGIKLKGSKKGKR